MRVLKKSSDALSNVLSDDALKRTKAVLNDDGVVGWSVFDTDGIEIASDGVSDRVTAVTSNILDLAAQIGEQLGEDAARPSVSLSKTALEMYSLPIEDVNLLVVRDKSGGFRKEFK